MSPPSGTASPFVLPLRRKVGDLGTIFRAHRRALGALRGTLAMAATVGRFVGTRRRVGRIGTADAPMVDDSVAIAVAMYQTLSRRIAPDAALAAVERAIVEAGVEMMAAWVPEDRSMEALGAQVRLIMGDAEDRGIYGIDDMSTNGTGIRWDVTSCRYAELTRALDAPEVGTVFCAVDQPFVAGVVPELAFSCDTTIARGADRCRFRVGDEV